MNPLVIAAVLPYLNNLSHLNLEGTNFDDFGLEQLGTWVSGNVSEISVCIKPPNNKSRENRVLKNG